MGEVIAQVRTLCVRGYREIVLTGVDLTSYGTNLPGAPKLGTLVKQIFKHAGHAFVHYFTTCPRRRVWSAG